MRRIQHRKYIIPALLLLTMSLIVEGLKGPRLRSGISVTDSQKENYLQNTILEGVTPLPNLRVALPLRRVKIKNDESEPHAKKHAKSNSPKPNKTVSENGLSVEYNENIMVQTENKTNVESGEEKITGSGDENNLSDSSDDDTTGGSDEPEVDVSSQVEDDDIENTAHPTAASSLGAPPYYEEFDGYYEDNATLPPDPVVDEKDDTTDEDSENESEENNGQGVVSLYSKVESPDESSEDNTEDKDSESAGNDDVEEPLQGYVENEDGIDSNGSFTEKEKKEMELQEMKDEKRAARKIGGGAILLCLVLMMLTAHQMSENPDGVFANICRLAMTVTGCIFKILLYPCKKLCGNRFNGYEHHLVTTQDFSNNTWA